MALAPVKCRWNMQCPAYSDMRRLVLSVAVLFSAQHVDSRFDPSLRTSEELRRQRVEADHIEIGLFLPPAGVCDKPMLVG